MNWSKRHILLYGTSIAAVGYVFSIATTSIGIFSMALAWLINVKEHNFNALFSKKNIVLIILFTFFLLFNLSISLDETQGKNLIFRHISLPVFALFFATIKPFNLKERLFISRFYSFSISVFISISIIYAIYRQIVFSNQGGHFNWYFFYRYDFLDLLDQHPTYVAMYTLLSLSFLLFNRKLTLSNKYINYFIILLHLLGIILIGSRIGYIILVVLILIHFYRNIRINTQKNRVKVILVYVLLLFISIGVLSKIPIVKERILFTLGYNYDYKYNSFIKDQNPVTQGRMLLWEDAVELIIKKPFFGYGLGSNDIVLAKKYKEKNQLLFLEKEYNVHNMYLELLVAGGIFLLLLYIGILVSLLLNSISNKSYVAFSFFIIMLLTSITETIFRVQGIVFIAFFYSFFLFSDMQRASSGGISNTSNK